MLPTQIQRIAENASGFAGANLRIEVPFVAYPFVCF
jgi:hypothetical protein